MTTATLGRWGLVALDQCCRNGSLVLTAALVSAGIYARTQPQMPNMEGEWSSETMMQCHAAIKAALIQSVDPMFTWYILAWAWLVFMATGGTWRRAVTACAPLLVLWVGVGCVLWAL